MAQVSAAQISLWQQKITGLNQKSHEKDFEEIALSVFRWQAQHNKVYRTFLQHLNRQPEAVQSINDIPFMPIDLFKHHEVKTGSWQPQTWFESSGTTGSRSSPSRHFIHNTDFYHNLATRTFEHFYGLLDNFIILALLPSYLERQNASLVDMVNHFIIKSKHKLSGFFLRDDEMSETLNLARQQTDRKILIWGVSFALLDWVEKVKQQSNFEPLPAGTIVMETGGMKGRRKEIIKEELHSQLTAGLGVQTIHNEYGMTEMLSQAYDGGTGIFSTPPQLRILLRDLNDPLSPASGHRGGINVIDLANVHSCAFIATQDMGQWHYHQNKDDVKGFSVLGRYDHSDLRGCNLMIS